MKRRLLKILNQYTLENKVGNNECFTALFLAKKFDLSRNSVSEYLNELVNEGKVIKINTRPVYFLEKSALNEKGYHLTQSVYSSFGALEEAPYTFSKLIGHEGSLKYVIEQSKAAITYPDSGLPILLNGPTGTGKSFIASLLFEYAQSIGIIAKDSKFVVVNCSEYANNPELLTANLFGHKKGAYTGADSDNKGLIQVADGGVLFLDEVHALKADCQEKLFLFMDSGMFHRVGDNENWYKAKCRMIFATTENPEQVLLKTLLRRIPIVVKVPSLQQRSKVEREMLVKSILDKESQLIHMPIKISTLAYQLLSDLSFAGNVGGLKNCIKASCANAFLEDHAGEYLEIRSYHLPEYILNLAPVLNVNMKHIQDNQMITLNQGEDITNKQLLDLYENVICSFEKYNQTDLPTLMRDIQMRFEEYNTYLMYKNDDNNPNIEFLNKVIDKIFSIMINRYSLTISNNDIVLITRYLSESKVEDREWFAKNKLKIEHLNEFFHERYYREYSIANEIVENIKLNLDYKVDAFLVIRILFVIFEIDEKNVDYENILGVILCHGYSTASSISDAVNKMLGKYVFDSIDMELNVSEDRIVMKLNELLKKKKYYKSVLLLVDMGSLENIYQKISNIGLTDIGLINNVNTKLALAVGSKIIQGEDIRSILEDCTTANISQYKLFQNKIKKKIILSVCATGEGSAIKIMKLFKDSLKHLADIDVLAYDYNDLVKHGMNDPIFKKYEVIFIIGTINPYVDGVAFIAIEDLILNNKNDELKKLMSNVFVCDEFDVFIKNIVSNFTLDNIVNHLTILNAQKVLDDVSEVIRLIENGFQISLSTGNRMGLSIHLACLTERLILKNEIEQMEGIEKFVKDNRDKIDIINNAFSVVKEKYSVDLPVSEVIYILNYIDFK